MPARAGIDAALDRWAGWVRWDEEADAADLVVCHGDVHPGNVVMTTDGPVLIDWDLMSRAPAGWDHAPLMTWTERWGGAPGVYEAFADGYGRSLRGDPVAEGYAELRLLAATLMRLRAGRSDPAARIEADRRLAYWRGDPDGADLDRPVNAGLRPFLRNVPRFARWAHDSRHFSGRYGRGGSGAVGRGGKTGRMSVHPIELSTRLIDSGALDTPPNRVTQELSELGDGVALIESFSHVLVVDSGDGLIAFDSSGAASGAAVLEALRTWSAEPRAHDRLHPWPRRPRRRFPGLRRRRPRAR